MPACSVTGGSPLSLASQLISASRDTRGTAGVRTRPGAAAGPAALHAHHFHFRKRRRTRPAPPGTNGPTGGGGLFSPAPRRARRSPRLQRAAVRAAAMEEQKENRPQAARPPVSAGHAPSGARPGPAPSLPRPGPPEPCSPCRPRPAAERISGASPAPGRGGRGRRRAFAGPRDALPVSCARLRGESSVDGA